MQLNAPLQNRVLCYGLLEMAREIVMKQPTEVKAPSGLVVPKIGVRFPKNGPRKV